VEGGACVVPADYGVCDKMGRSTGGRGGEGKLETTRGRCIVPIDYEARERRGA
jgi:hypothetical protein